MRQLKKYLSFMILIILCFSINININAEELSLNSKNIVLYNMNDKNIIYEEKKDEVISIASLTKIMTSIVALENLDLNKKITITNEFFNNTEGLSMAGFKVGDIITVEDLLYGAMLPSGADACIALALATSKNENDFVSLMNAKAKEIGMKNTSFMNVTGKDQEGHFSTVHDVSLLLQYALKNEEFNKIFKTKEYKTTNNIDLVSSVKKMGEQFNIDTSLILGSKTGYTDDAGLCLASVSEVNDIDYLLVTCGAPVKDNIPYHIIDANKIYKYYGENYDYIPIIKKGDVIKKLKVENGKEEEYLLKQEKTIKKYLKKDADIKVEYSGVDTLNMKIVKGDKLGTVKIYADDEEITSYDVYLNEKIKYKFLTIKNIIIMCFIGAIILILFKFFRKKR